MNRATAAVGLGAIVAGAVFAVAGCPFGLDDAGYFASGGGASDSAGSGAGGSGTKCPNGQVDENEACDDGNDVANDGCTKCVVDPCYTCDANVGGSSTCQLSGAGTPCDGTKVCNDAGACVVCNDDKPCQSNGGVNAHCYMNECFRCDDGAQNGDEADIDCGGTNCTEKCAQGKKCDPMRADCMTGLFCADGVCCDIACDMDCTACNVVGSIGTCDYVPKYEEDGACTVANKHSCNGMGLCGNAVGEMCSGNLQCASGKCSTGSPKICVKITGETCTDSKECASGLCMSGMCT